MSIKHFTWDPSGAAKLVEIPISSDLLRLIAQLDAKKEAQAPIGCRKEPKCGTPSKALWPCGHIMCETCALTVSRCPSCKRRIIAKPPQTKPLPVSHQAPTS